jgi:PHP family Zn ribbon phosphoesterase
LPFEALEITCFTTANESGSKFQIDENVCIMQNSDAHFSEDIGKGFSFFVVEELTYEEVKLAMLRKSFHRVILQK